MVKNRGQNWVELSQVSLGTPKLKGKKTRNRGIFLPKKGSMVGCQIFMWSEDFVVRICQCSRKKVFSAHGSYGFDHSSAEWFGKEGTRHSASQTRLKKRTRSAPNHLGVESGVSCYRGSRETIILGVFACL